MERQSTNSHLNKLIFPIIVLSATISGCASYGAIEHYQSPIHPQYIDSKNHITLPPRMSLPKNLKIIKEFAGSKYS